MSQYDIRLLSNQDRATFACGSPELDQYLRERASQDMKRRVASCFVAMDAEGELAGFYTIAATSLVLDQLPDKHLKRLPRYPAVPAVLLGRLAVANRHQGRGLGGALVADALLRSSRADLMAYAMVVDAKNEQAVQFYQHLGFERLGNQAGRLVRAL